jgi:plastocyanin domain-containing protein
MYALRRFASSSKKTIFGSLVSLGLLLSVASNAVLAKMPAGMSANPSDGIGQFHRIEQPLALKVGIALGGVALIGLELWWFLLSKNKNQAQ